MFKIEQSTVQEVMGAKSMIMEAYRALGANLVNQIGKEKSGIVVFAAPDEKTNSVSVVQNLAFVMMEMGRKVLVIDAELRNKALTRESNKETAEGFAEWLLGDTSLQGATQKDAMRHFEIMPAGKKPIPAGMLARKEIENAVQSLKDVYDCVLVLTSAMDETADALMLGQVADGAIIVLTAGKSRKQVAELAKEKLEAAGVKVFGAILSEYDVKTSTKLDGYYYMYKGRDKSAGTR